MIKSLEITLTFLIMIKIISSMILIIRRLRVNLKMKMLVLIMLEYVGLRCIVILLMKNNPKYSKIIAKGITKAA